MHHFGCKIFIIAVLFFIATIALSIYVTSQSDGADIVLHNGVIQTMVNENDVHQAVAIKDGEIIYVGNDTDVEEYIGTNTEVIDLEGKMVTPGFMDSHIHSVGTKLTELFQISLFGLTTLFSP
jgi:predicted amidohydrolase YtcJ